MLSGLFLPLMTDRYKLIPLLRFSQLAQLGLLLVLLLLFIQESTPFILTAVFIILFFISFFNGLFSPIKSTLVKSIVHESMRVKAISFIASIDQTFLFVGWTFGGLVLSLLGKETTLMITFCLILLSMAALFLIEGSSTSVMNTREGLISKLTSGWKYLFQHPGLRTLIILDLLEALVGSIWMGAVTLTFVEEALHKGETWWGYINGGYYLGTIVGGFMVYRLSKIMRGRLVLFMLSGSIIFGLLTFTYGFISHPYLALIIVLFMGPAYQIRDLAQETMFLNSTNEDTLTKMLAAKSTLIQFIFIFSIIGIGALTDLIGVRLVYILSGCLLIASSIYGFFHLHIGKKGISLETEC